MITLIRTLFFLLIITDLSFSQVRLPKLLDSGMVLQRGRPITLWGWASPNEKIKSNFDGIIKSTTADAKGNWNIVYPKMVAGGPYKIQIEASNKIELNDIMIGDVWICSGQSNMELTMQRVSPIYKKEISESENPNIRYFEVPHRYNFIEPQNDLLYGSWIRPNPETILTFSAVSYFFGNELQREHNIPIGLINASLGGSRIECWMSENALQEFPNHYNEAMIYQDTAMVKKIIESDQAREDRWYKVLKQKDKGYKEKDNPWFSIDLNTEDWNRMNIPGYLTDTKIGNKNGVVWLRKKIDIPESLVGVESKLILGRIVDADSVYVNGKFIGATSYQYPPRRYDIPIGILKEGENIITIRVISHIGKSGFVLDKKYSIVSENTEINLEVEWKYKLGAEMPPLEPQTFIRWKPMGLFNGMIAPLLNYNIKGVIWYQGESNAGKPNEYKKLFPSLIEDWRKKWNIGDFPFLYVQLPNFMEAKTFPAESNWAVMREAQLEALSIPNAGMAITIDLGEWNDIHPLNKKDVAHRLFLAAEKVAYSREDIISSGPIYKSMEVDSNKIILSFNHIGEGLVAKDNNKLKGFSISGDNYKFVWANAKIENNKVIVWCDSIKHPVNVRYAWADNPVDANLYNSAMLPASPFRTNNNLEIKCEMGSK